MKSSSSISVYSKAKAIKSADASLFLDIDRVRANPVYKTVVTLPNGRQIIGILDTGNNFDISTGATYQETMSMPSFAETLNAVSGLVANSMSGTSQFICQSIRMTEARWTNTENPSFTLRIDIPVIRAADNPWAAVDAVLRCTTARAYTDKDVRAKNADASGAGIKSEKLSKEVLLYAPNGYRVNYGKTEKDPDCPEGTISVAIGNWFEAHHMLMTNATTSISGKKHYDGTPMSVAVQFSFVFWRKPLYDDLKAMFKLITV